MAQTPEPADENDLEAIQRNSQGIPATQGRGLQTLVGLSMSRISGGAGWWKSPSPNVVRAPAG